MSGEKLRPYARTMAAVGIVMLLGSVSSTAEELVISEHAIVNTGHHVYLRSCAVCHGREAEGDGPYASMLRVAPPALNTLAKSNGGVFPFEKTMETISGSELMPFHGTRDMPIWGQEFAAEADTLGMDPRSLARNRLLELMTYLQSIQQQ